MLQIGASTIRLFVAALKAYMRQFGRKSAVHLDVKGENLMLTRADSTAIEMRVIDFGHALSRQDWEKMTAVQKKKHVRSVGTYHYDY